MDDEPLALEQLKNYISKLPDFELVAACSDAYEALKVLHAQGADAIFADINMPDLSGLDLIRSLGHKPLVVFTTAYADYAVAGYEVDALAYLLKPIGMPEFMAAADKVRRQYALLQAEEDTYVPPVTHEYVYVKVDRRMVRIAVADIRYVVGMSEYVRIYLEGVKKPLMPLTTMKKMEETLPVGKFMRIHKSYIVNTAKIQSVSKTNVQLDADTCLPVGEAYREAFYKWVNERAIGR